MTSSPFCEHKKLRTGCPICKAGAVPPPPKNVTPFVTEEEREKKEERSAKLAAMPKEEREREIARDAKTVRPTGPGKPLMPSRPKKNRNISASEAEQATAWWVKK